MLTRSTLRAALAAVLVVGLTTFATAADKVSQRQADGKPKDRNGKIKEVTKEAVVLELTPTTKTDTIPANTIESVSYEGQPLDMNQLITAARGGNFKNADDLLKKLTGPDVTIDNAGVKDELAFYR